MGVISRYARGQVCVCVCVRAGMQAQDGEVVPQAIPKPIHTHCMPALTAGKGGGEGQVAADHVLHADGVLCKDTRGKRRSCGKVQLATSACKLHADHGLCTLNTPCNLNMGRWRHSCTVIGQRCKSSQLQFNPPWQTLNLKLPIRDTAAVLIE